MEKPALQVLLERVAEVMELDDGRHRLELVFVGGRLERWWTHSENRAAAELDSFSARASHFGAVDTSGTRS